MSTVVSIGTDRPSRARDDDIRGLIDRFPDGVMRFRREPRPCFELVNRTLAALAGLPESAFFADPRLLVELTHDDDKGVMVRLFDRGPHPDPLVVRLRARNGGWEWFEIRGVPVRDAGGNASVFEAVVRRLPVRSALRPPTAVFGDLRIEVDRSRAYVGEKLVHLTPSELRVLVFLTEHAGDVVTREAIVRDLWQTVYDGGGGAAETHISALRRKIERDPRSPTRILTVRGQGYRFVP